MGREREGERGRAAFARGTVPAFSATEFELVESLEEEGREAVAVWGCASRRIVKGRRG